MLDGKNVLCTAETGILHLPIFHTYGFKNCLFLIWLLCRQRGHKHKMKFNWKPRIWWTFFKSNRENICVSEHNFVAGSGKTLSYLLPIIENVLQWNDSCGPPKLRNHPLAIVIVPSHELAEQVQGVVEDTIAQLDVKVIGFYFANIFLCVYILYKLIFKDVFSLVGFSIHVLVRHACVIILSKC